MPPNVGSSGTGHQRLAQPSRHAPVLVGERAHIILCGIPRQRYPDRLARERAQPHGRQHVAHRHLAGTASGARADGNPRQIQRDHLRISPYARQGDTRCVAKPERAPAAYHGPFSQGRPLNGIAQRGQRRRFASDRSRRFVLLICPRDPFVVTCAPSVELLPPVPM